MQRVPEGPLPDLRPRTSEADRTNPHGWRYHGRQKRHQDPDQAGAGGWKSGHCDGRRRPVYYSSHLHPLGRRPSAIHTAERRQAIRMPRCSATPEGRHEAANTRPWVQPAACSPPQRPSPQGMQPRVSKTRSLRCNELATRDQTPPKSSHTGT